MRCNSLVPGTTAKIDAGGQQPAWLQTAIPNSPLVRVTAPQDLVEAALFLACDAAGFINGATLTVDGGMSARLPEYQAHLKF